MSGRRRVLVFIHINKTAGTTLRYILRSSYGTRHCDVEPWHGPWTDPPFSTSDLQRVRRLYPRLASIAGHRISGHTDLEEAGTDLRYVTFLREPIALCASRFQYRLDHRKRSDLSFEEWIQKDWARDAQTQRIGGTTDANDAIDVIRRKNMFIGLTEAFDESMILLQALRAPDLDIRYAPVNVAKSSNIAKDLLADERTRGMLVEANRADLELYEHVKRELFPAQLQEYGPSLPESVGALREEGRKGFNRRNLAMYGIKQREYQPDDRSRHAQVRQHGDIMYEPEKCIKCGLCIRITELHKETLGLTWIGRGFDVTVSTPFNEGISTAVTTTAAECVDVCPTAALSYRDHHAEMRANELRGRIAKMGQAVVGAPQIPVSWGSTALQANAVRPLLPGQKMKVGGCGSGGCGCST